MCEQIVRQHGQWVRITRDDKKCFTLARGWDGVMKAHHIEVWPPSALTTWKDAEEVATRMIHHWK